MIIKNNNTFHLQGRNISYIMAVSSAGDLIHIHFGKKLRDRDYSDIKTVWHDWLAYTDDGISLDLYPQEYPAYGHSDLRFPSYSVKNRHGNHITQLKFKSAVIKENAVQQLEGMPSLFQGGKTAQTLEITMYDEIAGLEAVLSYTVYDEYDVILRSARLKNNSDCEMIIDSAYSASLDIGKGEHDLIYFPGAWARERELVREKISYGVKIDISNARGGSGHSMNPFIMVAERNADESHGAVYGLSLIYSGNHSSMVECDQYGNIRIHQGLNPFRFQWSLESGEEFTTPQSVLCYSGNGIGGLSRELNDIYRSNLCRSKWSDRERPILINNWEATYYDFDEEKLLDIAKKAKDVGVELFVLDDGWFGDKGSCYKGLGDWIINKKKLPSGISGLADKINSIGLKFGLWFEPENINPDSEILLSHPDWAVSVSDRASSLSINRLMFDLSRNDVCEYIIDKISGILRNANIEYVKWDMNRPMTDIPYDGYNHKYTLGFYRIMDAITSAFPDILFEGCSGGGGRFDAGVLAYMPQIWTSDNSDAVSRLKIQYSTSMGYPVSSMTAHVTAVPNHQNGRVTPLGTRAATAYCGIFGYELDITKMKDDELLEIADQIRLSKELRHLVLTGDFYRLISPYDTNYCAWEMTAKDSSEAFLFACRILSVANSSDLMIKLKGLDENSDYLDVDTGVIYGGDELMYRGIEPLYEKKDFAAVSMLLKKL